MRPLALAALLPLLGCSITLDGNEPALEVMGQAPDLSAVPRLNRLQARSSTLVTDVDGRRWLVIVVVRDSSSGRGPEGRQGVDAALVELVPLDAPDERRTIETASNLVVGERALYYTDLTVTDRTVLAVREVGGGGRVDHHLLADGAVQILAAPGDEVFAYTPSDVTVRTYEIVRRDGSFRRQLTLPASDEAAGEGGRRRRKLSALRFSGDGEYLVSQEADGRLVSHSTRIVSDVDMGARPPLYVFDDDRSAVLTAGGDGLLRMPLDGQPVTVLDGAICRSDVLRIDGDDAVYAVGDELRRVALDGKSAPRAITTGKFARVLAFGPAGQVVTSRDTALTYDNASGDGWLGAWRFMERGRRVQFSVDGARLRWLEHTALNNGAGILYSATIPEGEPAALARNVIRYDELADGRVLAAANQAFVDFANRIVLVDEAAGVARWLAKGASDYRFIPDTGDLIVDLVSNGAGHDIVRLAIPPRD